MPAKRHSMNLPTKRCMPICWWLDSTTRRIAKPARQRTSCPRLIASGKPALVLPYIGMPPPIFSNVLVAWKETPQAAHALSAALPLLASANAVHIAIDGDISAQNKSALRKLLHCHGLAEPEFHALSSSAADAGALMLSMAADVSADLMVMGCCGHSRARELVLGGASRSVLGAMTLPVLMAH